MATRVLSKAVLSCANRCLRTRCYCLTLLTRSAPAETASEAIGGSRSDTPDRPLMLDLRSARSHGVGWQRDPVLPRQRFQVLPSRIGDWHSVALANCTHRELRLTWKEHGFHSLSGQTAGHRGALRLDLSSEPLQVGEAGDVDGQDEWTIYATRAVIVRRIHLRQSAAN